MIRQTSIETYESIRDNGLLSKRRWEVYDALYKYGPMTANQMVRHYKTLYPESNPSGWHARFSELEKLGVVQDIGTLTDEVSGHECILWDVTNGLPIKIEKKSSAKVSKTVLIQKIEDLGRSIPPQWKQPLREIWRIANNI